MASIDDNLEQWGRPDAWPEDGDVWSRGWGGPASQWSSWIAPRVREAAGDPPYRRIVEIGSGHGRWTQFLAGWAPEVVALDLVPECVEACVHRFAEASAVHPMQGDGRSLSAVADRSVDLVFSFDSLVHADADAMGSYIAEIARVLTDDGTAWIHHSNLRSSRLDRSGALRRIGLLHRTLVRAGAVEPEIHWRDPTVDAALVARHAGEHGLTCPSQELLRWSTRRTFIDCVSVLVREDSTAGGVRRGRWENRRFEAEREAALASA